MADTTTMQTTVKNPLGFSRVYGYLGYHGRELASLAEYSQIGSLIDYIMAGKPTHKRWSDALQRDLLAGNIIVLKTPAPILHDTVSNQVKALSLSGGALGVVDPSWGAYTGA